MDGIRRVAPPQLEGYRITQVLRDSSSRGGAASSGPTQVYAAVRERDQRAVLVKVHELDEVSGADVRIDHEFRGIRQLQLDGVVDVLALERTGTRVALVHDWWAGVNLHEYAGGRPLPVGEFLAIAVQIARALDDLHRCKLIHRDIKPTNLFVDPETKVAALGDLGISVLHERVLQRIEDPWVIDSCLPYVSPEQTGRTHHAVDFRSDLYSLGISFYELLTARRPFDASTPLELIHAHLARRPQSPQWHRPELPTVLSAIVMKLIEKAPERRYQSARGLLRDLERVAVALDSGAAIDGIALGRDDVPTVLQLPHRLYGRSREIEQLNQRLREASTGQAHVVFVSGGPGVGKTALVNQMIEPVMSRHGYWARGKFERDAADKPYAAVFGAFAQLADQLLTQSDEQLDAWRRRLRAQLGTSAAVLWEVVPSLRPILGAVEPVPGVGPLESRNRLAVACAGLVSEFARIEHPLLLSFEDAQWADAGTCELIAALLVETTAALLIVVEVREQEIPDESPLHQLIHALTARPVQSSKIELGPLAPEDVAALVADTLAWPDERTRPLADIVGRHTSCNPLFVGQYLSHLFEFGLLRSAEQGWEWDAEAIEASGVPEDLLGMMAAKLELLTEPQRELLSAAAVIGNRFDIAALRAVVAGDVIDLALTPLLREGLLTTLPGARYGFTHDHIRDTAYRMNSVARRAELHRLVGDSCLARSGLNEMDESFFELVDHLDLGWGLMALDDEELGASQARARDGLARMSDEQRAMLAEFNALAGHNALIGAAPRAATRYFEGGLALLVGIDEFLQDDEPDQLDGRPPAPGVDHELRFALELGRCQALGLAGDRAAAERRFDRLLHGPLDFTRIGRAIAGRVEVRIADGDRLGAIACGLEGLARLGVEPVKQGVGPDDFPINRLVPMLRSDALRKLGDSLPLRTPRLEAALEILTGLIPVSYLIDPELHVAFVTEHIGIMLEHGRFRSAPIALAYAAMYVGTAVGQRQLALEIAELARTYARHEGPGAHQQRIEPPYWVVASWVRPYAEGLAPLRDSVELALAAGDLEVAGHATDMGVTMSLSAGVRLSELEHAAETAVRRLAQWQAGPLVLRAEAYLDIARQLLAGDEAQLDLHEFEIDTDHRPSQYMIRTIRAFGLCIFGRWQEAFAELNDMEDFQRVVFGAWQMCDHALLHGLSAAVSAEAPGVDEQEREGLLFTTQLSFELLDASAELGPINCIARAALLEAEIHAAQGNSIGALSAYAKSHRHAAASNNLWLEALAHERSAACLRRIGLDELALGSLRDARAGYRKWGAFTKLAALDRLWPQLREGHAGEPVHRRASSRDSDPLSASRALDLASILKASQAIAADLQLADVVDRVMAIALENAGAQRGALLLPGPAGLELVALCSTDGARTSFAQARGLELVGSLIPVSLLRWVERTREPTLLDDASQDPRFAHDAYIAAHGVRSVLAVPIVKHDRLVGLLYLENNLSAGNIAHERVELIDLLMAQAASALQNAQLFEALRGSEVRWRSLVEGLPDVIMLVDPRGRVEFVNDTVGRAPSVAPTPIGAHIDSLVEAEFGDALHEQLSRAVGEAHQTELELRASLRGTDVRWYAVRLAPIAVDGRVERVIVVGTDITERREAALAQQQHEAQSRQQQRLESIGTLASGVAHEINNPVQGIMNYAELIGNMAEAGSTTQEFAHEIGHEAQRVADIVRSLLSFSRAEGESSVDATDIRDVIGGTLLLVRTVIGKDQVELSVSLPTEPITVHCRAQQIRQVFMNLVTNARDALRARWTGYHPDKRIDITCEKFTSANGRPWVRVSVRDRGGGVPPEVVNRIFDPFFTTKGRDQGTGLGLSVSHGIVSEHGGELRLDNEPGVGACFHIELPVELTDSP